MSLADVLLIGVVAVLVSYGALALLAFRRTRDPGSILVLTFAAYWSLVGAVSFLVAKRVAGGTVYTYLEDRLFPVSIDGVYALALLAYSVFLLIGIGTFIVLSRPYRAGGAEALPAWERLSQRFAHPRMLVIIAGLTAAKVFIVRELVAANGGAGSLYEATRTVKGSLSGELRIYQYLNISTSYALATGFALWLGFQSGRMSYRPAHRLLIWGSYLVMLAEVVGENALLGNRAVLLVVMAGVAAGWARWRYLPSEGRTRSGLTLMLVALSVAALLGLGAIGNARGGGLTTPSAIAGSLVANLEDPSNVLAQVGNSAEKVASHMSLVGVLRYGPDIREPLAANSYVLYTTLVNAPADQVFTIHPVAAWWLRVGPAGVLVAGLLLGVALAFFQRLSFRPGGAVFSAFALPAAVLPAAGLPVIMLRTGPEAIRSVVIELLVIPALLCLPATLFGREPQVAGGAPHPVVPPKKMTIPTSGVSAMTTPITSDLARAFAAVRRRWWVVVAAAVLGAVIGLAGARGGEAATYDVSVATPTVVTSNGAVFSAPGAQLASDLKSSETTERLGDVVDDTTIVTTVLPDPGAAVDIRVTAPTPERAQTAAAAYAQAMTDAYDESIAEQAQQRLTSVQQGIDLIGDNTGDRAIATLAELKVEQAYLQALADHRSTVPDPVSLTSSGTSTSTVILLAIAFAGLAAAVVGFLGIGSRTLRFSDDVTAVSGDDGLVAAVPSSGSWALGGLIDRLATESGRTVTLVPVGTAAIDDLRDGLLVGVEDPSHVRFSPPVGAPGVESPDGPVLLVARLGTDTRRQ
ncbi:hypothetical protein ACFP8W_12415, partial [Nocardioides hankookensis]